MKKRKPRVLWVIEDCRWGTLRTAHWTRKEALASRDCKSCDVIKFIEADRKKG